MQVTVVILASLAVFGIAQMREVKRHDISHRHGDEKTLCRHIDECAPGYGCSLDGMYL
jgi:hypothetical protein